MDFFLENSNCTKFQRDVLITRISGMTIKEQAMFFHCGESTVNRAIRVLKDTYDAVQREYPDELPKRKMSEAERYLDEH